MQDEEAGAIAALRSGDLNGLETLVRLHQVGALRVAANICRGDRQMAEDVVADAFLSVYRSIHSFDPTRPFLPWFYRIVIHAARSALKQAARERTVDDSRDLLRDRTDPSQSPEWQVVRQEQTESLLRLIDALPMKQREVIVLRYYLDLSVSPPVPFQLLNLSYVPTGLTSYQFSRLLANTNGWSAIGSYGSFDIPALEKEVAKLDADSVNGVLLRYQEPPPGTSYVEVIEQVPVPGANTGGTATAVGGAAARVEQVGAMTTVRIERPDVLITIRSNHKVRRCG